MAPQLAPCDHCKIGKAPMNSTNSGRRWVRTTGPSLVRRSFTVAGHRLTSPITAANCTDRRRASPYIAGSLALLAPRLAPGISLALLIKTNVAGLLSGTRAKVAPAELEASGRQVDEISWCLSPCRRGGNPEPDRATRRGQGRRRPTGRTERPGYLSKCTDFSIHHSTVSSRSRRISRRSDPDFSGQWPLCRAFRVRRQGSASSYTKWRLLVYMPAGLRTGISAGADTTAIWPRLHRRPGIARG